MCRCSIAITGVLLLNDDRSRCRGGVLASIAVSSRDEEAVRAGHARNRKRKRANAAKLFTQHFTNHLRIELHLQSCQSLRTLKQESYFTLRAYGYHAGPVLNTYLNDRPVGAEGGPGNPKGPAKFDAGDTNPPDAIARR